MNIKNIFIFYIAYPVGIIWILKTFVLKIKPSKKEKILLKYAPNKLFLIANLNWICAFVNSIYSEFYAFDQDWAMNYLILSMFFWFSIATWGRRRYFKSINNKKESKNDVLLFVLLIITMGILKFS